MPGVSGFWILLILFLLTWANTRVMLTKAPLTSHSRMSDSR